MTSEEKRRAVIQEGRKLYSDSDISIEDHAPVSESSNGDWVQAWVWVPHTPSQPTP